MAIETQLVVMVSRCRGTFAKAVIYWWADFMLFAPLGWHIAPMG